MKKIIILETGAFNGRCNGESHIQAAYYEKLLTAKDYETSVFIGLSEENKYIKFWKVIKAVRNNDFIIGFGTPLLALYLQWLAFVFGKKGIFCIDTIIVSTTIIKDYLKRKIYPWKMIFQNIQAYLAANISWIFIPPKYNLKIITSSDYVSKKVFKLKLPLEEKACLYPRVALKKREKKYETVQNILFYGTLFRGRGILDLLDACRILWKKNYNFKLIILGWPVVLLTQRILSSSIRENEKKKIRIHGYVKDTRKYIRSAAAVVLPFGGNCEN